MASDHWPKIVSKGGRTLKFIPFGGKLFWHFKEQTILLFLFILAILLVGSSCAGQATSLQTSTVTTAAPATASPTPAVLEGPYLGQEPPGLTPVIFAPGIVSDPANFEYSGTFSPDGTEYYFFRFNDEAPSRIFFTKMSGTRWTIPEPFASSEGYAASEPHLTLDNRRLYFMWKRQVLPGEPGYMDEATYYFVERKPGGWTEPTYAGQGMFMSSSRDGQIYTTDMSSRKKDGRTYLAKVKTNGGVFAGFEKLDVSPRFGSQAHPCIALDGSYIIFDVDGGAYMYVSFKNTDGTWREAIDLTQNGFDPLAGGASISPDGKYLFFALDGDIWWVDIQVIENLRPET
jgi:hypothetical protein